MTYLFLLALFTIKELIAPSAARGPIEEREAAADWSFGGRPLVIIDHDPSEFATNWQPVDQPINARDLFPAERKDRRL